MGYRLLVRALADCRKSNLEILKKKTFTHKQLKIPCFETKQSILMKGPVNNNNKNTVRRVQAETYASCTSSSTKI